MQLHFGHGIIFLKLCYYIVTCMNDFPVLVSLRLFWAKLRKKAFDSSLRTLEDYFLYLIVKRAYFQHVVIIGRCVHITNYV